MVLVLCLAFSMASLPAMATTENQSGASAEQIIRGLGIMSGDENGNMNLSAYVTRAEFSKMLVMASEYKDTAEDGTGLSGFSDVKSTNWASEYIQIAVNHGWFVGYTDGTFRPNNTIKLEEASATVLRLLGYSSSDLAGTYPSAQITKYKSLGLNHQISKEQGELLTRQDCMNLFCNLMTTDTKKGDTYATTLGYSLTASGDLDYSALVASNLKGPYTVDSSGLVLPFSTTSNVTFYKDDKAAQLSDVEPYDIYYYNSNLRAVYLYRNLVTGTYTKASPNAVSPTSITVAGKSYTVGTTSATYKLSAMGQFKVGDIVTLLLGMDGTVADVVNATELRADDVDYAALLTDNLKGPYTVSSSGLDLPFSSTSNVTVYKNGDPAKLSDAELYDIYYYNSGLNAVYLYSNRVTGTYTKASPNTVSPTAVTVAGNSYSIGTSIATYKLSALGQFNIGDTVTLLLGMDGTVVDVIAASEQTTIYYGVVTAIGNESYTTESGAVFVGKTVNVACTDGVVRSFECNYPPTVGTVVQVGYSNGKITVQHATGKSISGTVNRTATMLGDLTFASDVQIMDTDTDGNYLRIYPSRLAGYTIDSDNVRFYVLDSSGKISNLILNDTTGDIYNYGLLTSVSEVVGEMSLSGTYDYIINGSSETLNTNHILYSVSTGAARFIYESGSISGIKNLTGVTVSSLGTGNLTANSRTYQISDTVQIYLNKDGKYTPVSLTTISDTNNYSLTAYYDNLGYAAGNLVRIIVAWEK